MIYLNILYKVGDKINENIITGSHARTIGLYLPTKVSHAIKRTLNARATPHERIIPIDLSDLRKNTPKEKPNSPIIMAENGIEKRFQYSYLYIGALVKFLRRSFMFISLSFIGNCSIFKFTGKFTDNFPKARLV